MYTSLYQNLIAYLLITPFSLSSFSLITIYMITFFPFHFFNNNERNLAKYEGQCSDDCQILKYNHLILNLKNTNKMFRKIHMHTHSLSFNMNWGLH